MERVQQWLFVSDYHLKFGPTTDPFRLSDGRPNFWWNTKTPKICEFCYHMTSLGLDCFFECRQFSRLRFGRLHLLTRSMYPILLRNCLVLVIAWRYVIRSSFLKTIGTCIKLRCRGVPSSAGQHLMSDDHGQGNIPSSNIIYKHKPMILQNVYQYW